MIRTDYFIIKCPSLIMLPESHSSSPIPASIGITPSPEQLCTIIAKNSNTFFSQQCSCIYCFSYHAQAMFLFATMKLNIAHVCRYISREMS